MPPSVGIVLRTAFKGAIVGAVWMRAAVVLGLGLVLLPVLVVGGVVAVFAAWTEQRTSRIGPWPAIAAGGAYCGTVFFVITLMINHSVATRSSRTAAMNDEGVSPSRPGLVAGIAATDGAGRLCVSMGRPMSPGDALTLVQPVPPQSARRATVVESVATCEPLAAALQAAPYYTVEPAADALSAPSSPLVAFPGAANAFEPDPAGRLVSIRIDGADVRVRSCASQEGLHLTVWAGTPLEGERLWHQYYYLGYDLEPTCDEREVGGR